ncbi:O-antigen ligase family protein [Methylocaldum sp.]|uniref:O-antigen ligase family protein n=1 Tax=Methylocaldum sp. TaxID=1969727 RepID=UPI002D2C3531|nr:O-antigen ligase family protein [Methylocaldum sp.]HYE35019.1 O-antigen ligase family protein [Methylocaldum sp.]
MAFRSVFLLAQLVLVINVEQLLGIANANPIEKLLFILAGLLFVFTHRRIQANLALLGLIVLVTFVCALLSEFDAFTWNRYVRSLVSLCAFLLFFTALPEDRDRDFMLLIAAFFPVVSVLLGAVYDALGLTHLWMTDYLGTRRLSANIGPAFLGGAGYTGAVAASYLALRRRPRYLLLALANTAITMLTASRMPSALALGVTGAVLFMETRSAVFRILMVLYGSVVVAGLFYLLGDQLLARVSSDSLSGRDMIWNEVSSYVYRYPYFGIGLGHQMDILSAQTSATTRTIAAHNEYLRFTVEVGYIGVSILGCAFIAMLVNLLRHPYLTKKWAFLMVCASFFVYSATDNTFSVAQAFMALVVAFIGSCGGREPVSLPLQSHGRQLFGTARPAIGRPPAI